MWKPDFFVPNLYPADLGIIRLQTRTLVYIVGWISYRGFMKPFVIAAITSLFLTSSASADDVFLIGKQ